MLLKIKIAFISLLLSSALYAQTNDSIPNDDTLTTSATNILLDSAELVSSETLVDETEKIDAPTFIATMDSTLVEFYRELEEMETDQDILNVFEFESNEVPDVSDSLYKKRLADLNAMTPFEFEWNDDVAAVIKMFAKRRRRFTSVTLARSALYFPMYEEKLAQYNMPLELKHLSVIESGLRPTAKSRAGALGLWQFMYRTGKMMDLDVNSYVDFRMDPYKATDAACRYLTFLYNMYDDWSMALAAYNAGPGNVNKAIRRSGGKMTYWEIRPHLPRETQNYVPFFIAMTYIMTYHAEHNIYPAEVEWHRFEVDTVCPSSSLKLTHLDSLLDMELADVKYLNPIFKSDIVPHTEDNQYCLTLPVDKVGLFIEVEDSIYAAFEKELEKDSMIIVTEEQYHYVRSGESLGVIAEKYRTSVRSIMNWNNMRSTRIYPGQKLIVKTRVEKPVEKEEKKSAQTTQPKSKEKLVDGKYYQIQRGDSLWVVSNKFGTTVDALKNLNPSVNPSNLKAGQKIRVK